MRKKIQSSQYKEPCSVWLHCYICNNRSFLKVLQNQRALETLSTVSATSIYRILCLYTSHGWSPGWKWTRTFQSLKRENNYSAACLHSVFCFNGGVQCKREDIGLLSVEALEHFRSEKKINKWIYNFDVTVVAAGETWYSHKRSHLHAISNFS